MVIGESAEALTMLNAMSANKTSQCTVGKLTVALQTMMAVVTPSSLDSPVCGENRVSLGIAKLCLHGHTCALRPGIPSAHAPSSARGGRADLPGAARPHSARHRPGKNKLRLWTCRARERERQCAPEWPRGERVPRERIVRCVAITEKKTRVCHVHAGPLARARPPRYCPDRSRMPRVP